MGTQALPPLSTLRVFDAVARHASFTRAAQELGMTQAAVSYQIRMLEERVGAPLFLRRPRNTALTTTGERLAPAVSEAFAILGNAFAAAKTGVEGTLTVSTLLTFGSNFLAQRLGAFHLAHPGIAVRIDTSNHLVDFAREEVDVAIRSGGGSWPGAEARFLFDASYTPVLSPALAASVGGLREPADLLKLTLLDPHDPWWAQWFAAAGVAAPDLASRPGASMGAQTYEAAAAMAGHGVAIVTRALFGRELAEGRLVQPFDIVGSDGNAYWLVYPTARRNGSSIKAFREWLLAEVRRSLDA